LIVGQTRRIDKTPNNLPARRGGIEQSRDGKLATVLYPGGTIPYTYTYDLMDRPVKMDSWPGI